MTAFPFVLFGRVVVITIIDHFLITAITAHIGPVQGVPEIRTVTVRTEYHRRSRRRRAALINRLGIYCL